MVPISDVDISIFQGIFLRHSPLGIVFLGRTARSADGKTTTLEDKGCQSQTMKVYTFF